MKHARRFVASMFLLGLTACASSPQPHPVQTSRPLVSPVALGVERAANQVVRGAIGDREMTLNCVITVKDGAMTVVGLNAMGVRLFTVRYDGTQIEADHSVSTPAELTPERLIADLQLVFWPLASLQQPLQAAGWTVSQPVPGIRRLRRGDRLIAEAHYRDQDPWAGRAWLANFEYGYSLQIDSRAL